MKTTLLVLLSMLLGACATGRLSDAQKLTLYRSHAGAPVKEFRIFGTINGFTPLGESAVAVWTRPSEAFLLELGSRCPDIDYANFIEVTSRFNLVSARFDRVIARGPSTYGVPCIITEIRPLDTKAIRVAEKIIRAENSQAAGASPSGT